jgi:peroxiredoxin
VSRRLLAAAIVALFGLSLVPGRVDARVVEVGRRPPLFVLPDEQGESHRLEDILGRPVVLYFTHNMCHYCTQVIAFLKRAHAAFRDDGLTIITLNVWADPTDQARATTLIRRYKEQFGLPFRMLAAKVPHVLRDYEVNYVPILVFVGRDGLVRHVEHHYILPDEFEARVREIIADD